MSARERSVIVGRDGRAKAYRPIPEADRAAALDAGLLAYRHGDFFEAHERLEPAWMGTAVPADRALLQGLIKLAAGYVHAVRGNPLGTVRNLEGARVRLAEAAEGRAAGPGTGDAGVAGDAGVPAAWLDLAGLIAAIDLRLADLAAHPDGPTLGPPELPGSLP